MPTQRPSIILMDKADDVRPNQYQGLSELSKQLRALQSTNHEQAATIDNLERKLKILTDLKGVSLHDLKSALWDACQGEAYNELTAEVRTLRSQLDLANGTNKVDLSEKHATQDIANLELRVGELEEVEESLQTEISELYESLRKKSSKVTELEASCDEYRNREMKLKEKYDSMKEKLDTEHRAAMERKEQELEVSSRKILDAECYGLEQKQKVDAFIIEVAEYQRKKEQLTDSKKELQKVCETMSRKHNETLELHQSEIDAKERKIESLQKDLAKSKSKEQIAKKKIQDLENQVAKIFSLELTIAKQKVQLKEIAEEKVKSSKDIEKMHKIKLDTAKTDIEELQTRAQTMEIKLKSEFERASELEKQVQQLEHVEKKLVEIEDELSSEKKKFESYKNDRDKDATVERMEAKQKLSDYELQVSELQGKLSKLEKESTEQLTLQISKANRLEEKCDKQNDKIASLLKNKNDLNEQVEKLSKEKQSALANVSEINKKLNDTSTKHKIEKSRADSLQKQIHSVEKEAKLRKNQFKSRFTVQSDRIKDLEQQLSSLYTAFNLERGERTEEQKNHDELRIKLDEADSKVAHQLHNYEEEKQGVSSKVPVGSGSRVMGQKVNVAAATSTTPQQQMRIGQQEDVIVEGFLLKKDKTKWRKRFYILHGSLQTGNFKLSYSEGKNKPTQVIVKEIQGSISRAFTINKFSKQPALWPFTFMLQVNPYADDDEQNTFAFATNSKKDLDMWMNAFNLVTYVVPTENQAPSTAPVEKSFQLGSKVVIVDLKNHPEYNGLTGVIQSPLKDHRQIIMIDELKQQVKLSPENLELFAVPDQPSNESVKV